MVFFTSTNGRYREKQKKKQKKKLLPAHKGQIFFYNQRKGLGLDILLIEEVVVVYHAVNEFADSDENY